MKRSKGGAMATNGSRRTRRTGRRMADGRGRAPAWVTLLAGLLIGAAAVWAWVFLRETLDALPTPATATPAKRAPKSKTPTSAEPPEKRYRFYEMLPNFEVVVPEEDREVRPDTTPAPLDVPGVYVLQAGSYGSFTEADRVKAQLALLGIRSQIQKISVDDRQYHRVRIGPIENLAELNRVRERLRDSKIDVLVIRVGE
jgi:cell division protein FtsN